MSKITRMLASLAALGVLGVSSVGAHVLDSTNKLDKPTIKLRADVAKQVSKYSFCLVKATRKCETKGLDSSVECNLATGVVSYEMPPGKETQKFQDAIAKCDAKMVLTKKGNDYTGIGCPGDCNAGAPGVQQCADMTAFEATVEQTTGSTSPKVQLGTLAAGIDLACSFDLPGTTQMSPERLECLSDNAAALSKYSQKLFKCQAKCENDYKGNKGGGGLTNGAECQSGAAGAAPEFDTCDDEALLKAGTMTPTVAGLVLPQVRSAINTATAGLYNRSDPTQGPAGNPCGSCGNGIRQGAEECDGADAAACPGLCAADCNCP
jgi:hypothetical protein